MGKKKKRKKRKNNNKIILFVAMFATRLQKADKNSHHLDDCIFAMSISNHAQCDQKNDCFLVSLFSSQIVKSVDAYVRVCFRSLVLCFICAYLFLFFVSSHENVRLV
jgi:hypothetical protein